MKFIQPRATFILLGAVLVLVLVGVAHYLANSKQDQKLADHSFGDITVSSSANMGVLSSAVGAAGKGNVGTVTAISGSAPAGGINDSALAQPMPINQKTYSYEASTVPPPDAKMDVYRRVVSSLSAGTLDQALAQVLSTRKLKGAKLATLNFTLESPAFMVTVAADGETNLSTTDQTLYTLGDSQNSLNETEAIKAADDFLDSIGVDRGGYEAPVFSKLGNGLITALDSKTDIASTGGPTFTSVVYPDSINGRPVFDTNGSRFGITISFSGNRITNVMGITRKSYEHSAYDTKTVEEIKQFVQHGGINDQPPGATTEKITLDSMTLAYVRYPNWAGSLPETLYLPAYAYKNKVVAGSYMPEYIVVPLVKGFDPQVYPLMAPGVQGGANKE